MKSTSVLATLRPHLLFVFGLFLLTALYFLPSFQGKELPMSDIRQSYAATKELRNFKDKTGEFPLWTNGLFSGMPSYMIAFEYPNTFVGNAVGYVTNLFPRPVSLLFFAMLSAYMLLVVMGFSTWLATLGAVAFGLGSYNMISIEAGHVSKVFAVAYAPGMLAGVILALRGRYWAGGALAALFVCLEFGANHVQITYYTFLLIGLYVLLEGLALVRAGRGRQLALGLAVLAVATVLGAGSYSKRLLVLNQYSKETIRGGSELTAKTTAAAGQPAAPTDGLDKKYAFEYSYGLGETITLLIPNAYGGSSAGGLDETSGFYQALVDRGVDPATAKQFVAQATPTYWGDQTFVGGPAYAGAVLLFLFVFGLLFSQNRIRWYVLAATLLLLAIAWGRNFLLLNGLLFDYLPYFNKFRAVTMTFTLLQLFLGIGAALGLQAVIERKPNWDTLRRPLLISLGATAGLALLMALLGSTFFSFRTPNDQAVLGQYLGQGAGELVSVLVRDRQSLMQADAFRSVIFIALAAGVLVLWALGRLRPGLALPLLTALVAIDLFSVSKRYLNNDDFVPKSRPETSFEMTAADAQILQDTTLGYRVFEQSPTFMTDNRASFYHRSIGGYHAAKLRRYQDLITYAFPKNTLNVLNMLNAKYVITPGGGPTDPAQPAPAGPVAQLNAEALGTAWFVQTVQPVADADAEIAAVQTLNPRLTAVYDQRFADQLRGLPARLDTSGSIRMTRYVPDHLVYESNAPGERLAVFSEIYYRGDTDWVVTIDGKPVPHLRVNYVLRALRLPPGRHTIAFRFVPPVVALGDRLDLIMNILLLAFMAGAVLLSRRTRPNVVADAPAAVAPEPARRPKR